MYKHLIFDVDGTLVDTLPSIISSINLTLKYFNKPYKYSLKDGVNLIGYGTPYLVKKAFKDENIDLDNILKIYIPYQIKIHDKKAKLFVGLKSTLLNLKKKGYKFYIATNKPKEVGEPVINKLYGKNFFIDGVFQVKDSPKKPNPYVINKIIKDNKLKRSECLYIGDGEVDILTAKNAKIDCCLVKYGYGKYGKFNERNAKIIINKPKELLNYLK